MNARTGMCGGFSWLLLAALLTGVAMAEEVVGTVDLAGAQFAREGDVATQLMGVNGNKRIQLEALMARISAPAQPA